MKTGKLKCLVLLAAILILANGCKPEEYDEDCSDDIQNYLKIWKEDSRPSIEFAQAAKNVLIHTERCDHTWLTLGNVVKKLGDQYVFTTDIEYIFDNLGNIEIDESRTQILYDNKTVIISFSVKGFANGVLYEISDDERRGWNLAVKEKESSQVIEKETIVAGTFTELKKALPLVEAALKFANGKDKEIDWYKTIVGPEYLIDNEDLQTYGGNCLVNIFLIDGITENISKVYYEITGKHILFYDTWWSCTDNKWEMIPREEAQEIIVKGRRQLRI